MKFKGKSIWFLVLIVFIFNSNLQANVDKAALVRCASHPTTARSSSCLHWTSLAAVNSLKVSPQCQSHVHLPLLMCIFKQEVGSFEQYALEGHDESKYCNQNGCGLSQMTGDGVDQVQNALKVTELMEVWKEYWNSLPTQPRPIKTPEQLVRKDAMDPFYGVVMASLHLCQEIRNLSAKDEPITVYKLAYHYNGNPKYQDQYAKSVVSCVGNGTWQTPLHHASASKSAKTRNRTVSVEGIPAYRRKSEKAGVSIYLASNDGRVHDVIPIKKRK